MVNLGKTKEKSTFRKILKFIEIILMIIAFFICTIIVVQRLTNNQYSFLGYRIFRVETGSMIPKYNIADVILVKEKDVDTIEIGEDLVYKGEKAETTGKVITHQVIRKGQDKDGVDVYYTQGIANKKEDPAVYKHQILGVVQQKLYSVTLIMNLILLVLSNKYIFYFCLILPLTIYIFFWELYGKEQRQRREERVKEEFKARNKKAQEKEEKQKLKLKEKEDRKSKRLGTREIKRIGSKETNSISNKENQNETPRRKTTKNK